VNDLLEPRVMVMALRLVISLFLGGAIGFEREQRGKEAGLRTHILVAIGSALIVMISVGMAEHFSETGTADPTRVAAGIITGIGFLGAGTIIRSEEGVKGLTTAASLWVAAAVGMATGGGFYAVAVFATVLSITSLFILHGFERQLRGYVRHTVTVSAKAPPSFAPRLASVIEEYGFAAVQRGGTICSEEGGFTTSFTLKSRNEVLEPEVIQRLLDLPEVTRVDWR